MVTLSTCLIWQIISFILSPNKYDYVYAYYASVSAPAIDLQKMKIGPFFFENVNSDRYRAMLNEILFTKIEEEDIGNIWFQ